MPGTRRYPRAYARGTWGLVPTQPSIHPRTHVRGPLPDFDRVQLLFDAHWCHSRLALTTANQVAGHTPDFENPIQCAAFKQALYEGKHFPIQACLYLEHRARLFILKSAVDYWLAKQRGELPKQVLRIGDYEWDIGDANLYQAFLTGVDELAELESFCQLPVLWQTFLFTWGGIILRNRLDEEYTRLSSQTGVPISELPVARTAFDKLFPVAGGWFASPTNEDRTILKLMPAALRGLGAYNRLNQLGTDKYTELGISGRTARRMIIDHNTSVRLLDGNKGELLR